MSQPKVLRTEKEKVNGVTVVTRYVEVDVEVGAAFQESDYYGFCAATEDPNILSVSTIHGGSRWQDVLHDEILELIPNYYK